MVTLRAWPFSGLTNFHTHSIATVCTWSHKHSSINTRRSPTTMAKDGYSENELYLLLCVSLTLKMKNNAHNISTLVLTCYKRAENRSDGIPAAVTTMFIKTTKYLTSRSLSSDESLTQFEDQLKRTLKNLDLVDWHLVDAFEHHPLHDWQVQLQKFVQMAFLPTYQRANIRIRYLWLCPTLLSACLLSVCGN